MGRGLRVRVRVRRTALEVAESLVEVEDAAPTLLAHEENQVLRGRRRERMARREAVIGEDSLPVEGEPWLLA